MIRNRINLSNANFSAKYLENFDQEVARSHSRRLLGKETIAIKDAVLVSDLDTADVGNSFVVLRGETKPKSEQAISAAP